MEELEALQRLQRKEERALLWFIERYSAYVTAIFRRMLGASATAADLEELASDVFFILWSKTAAIEAGKVKAYLGSVARNKARDFLRRRDGSLPLEEDVLLISPETPQQTLEARELAACLRAALDAMDDPEGRFFTATIKTCSPSPRSPRRWDSTLHREDQAPPRQEKAEESTANRRLYR